MKNYYIFLFAILVSIVLSTSCQKGTQKQHSEIEKIPFVEKILSQMTVEEKVGQMTQLTLDVITKGKDRWTSDEPLQLDQKLVKKALVDYHVGSILNTANNRARATQKWQAIIQELQKVATEDTRLKIPIIYGIDAIHGATYTAEGTMFPQQIGMAATFNRELVKSGASVCAAEVAACDIFWNFSPVLGLGSDPRWARQWETFGEDPYVVSELGVAMIEGMQGGNLADGRHVAACAKHYLGYSLPRSGKDRTPVTFSNRDLYEKILPPFEGAIKAGALTIMANSGIINGIPTHSDKKLLTDLLKGDLGFQGFVVTDWQDVYNLYQRDKVASTRKEAVAMAINAGVDMSMTPYDFGFTEDLVELVKEGTVPMSRIDDAVRRILNVKYKLGLFKNSAPYPSELKKEISAESTNKMALQTAQESITLLKNNKNILPLSRGKKILVCGPNSNSMRTLNGGWSYSWQGEKTEEFAGEYNTILEAMQKTFGKENIYYSEGVAYKMDGKYWEQDFKNLSQTLELAKKVDYIVLCLGENSYTEKPGDLQDLSLNSKQIELANKLYTTQKPIILVLNEGRPRLINDIEPKVEAVIQTYLPGNQGGNALASIISGEVSPSGRLPYTYPRYSNSLVTYNHKPSEGNPKNTGMYDYGGSFTPQYEFGYGLSYTQFEYSDIKLDNNDGIIEVSVLVQNIGTYESKESVLLFVSDEVSSITPDIKRLKGFQKINLLPNESKRVMFKINLRDLAIVDRNLDMVTEKGAFIFKIGSVEQELIVETDISYGQLTGYLQ